MNIETQTTFKKNSSSDFSLKDGLFKTIKVVFLTVFSLLMIYPLYWLITSAFKTNQEFFTDPYSFPTSFAWENFTRAWEVANLGQAMLNSTIVTISATALTVFLGALTAYAISRFSFKLKGFLVVYILLGMLIPVHSTLVPLFTMMNEIGLLNSYWALILPYTAFELPIAIFLTVAYMSAVPKELEEAAIIDGTGYWGIFYKIMLPLSVPALATVAILAFLRNWNEFVFALVFINDSSLKTLPLSLAVFSDGFSTDYSLTMAAMTIAVIPTILMYVLFQEQIMKGMVAGAVKG